IEEEPPALSNEVVGQGVTGAPRQERSCLRLEQRPGDPLGPDLRVAALETPAIHPLVRDAQRLEVGEAALGIRPPARHEPAGAAPMEKPGAGPLLESLPGVE